MSHLVLIDGYSLAFRAYYAFPASLTLSSGEPIHAVYGFLSLLFKAIHQWQPTHLAICMDAKEKTFRHVLFPEYKSHRSKAPDDFIQQMQLLDRLLNDLTIPLIRYPGYEADDLIGTLSKNADQNGYTTCVVTGDQDALQLASDHTQIALTKKSELHLTGPQQIHEQYNLSPKQLIDMKALKGDASDFIPGVSGIGEKTALKLLHEYETLENVYQHLNEIKPDSLQEKLKKGKEQAFLSYELATINCDVPILQTLEALQFNANWSDMAKVLAPYQFQSLIKKYAPASLQSANVKKEELVIIQTEQDLRPVLNTLTSGFSFLLDKTGFPLKNTSIHGMALCTADQKAYYVKLGSKDQLALFQEESVLLTQLKPFFENENIPKIGHEAKIDIQVLRHHGIVLKGLAFDTLLAAYVLQKSAQYSVQALSQRHLNETLDDSDPMRSLVDQARAIQKLHPVFLKQLETEPKLALVLKEIELPLQEVLADMEYTGITVDLGYLQELEALFSKQQLQLEEEIFLLSEQSFNIQSPKQLSDVLFNQLKLPMVKKTKQGMSTDASVLEALKGKHPVIEKLIEFRTISKLLSTYIQVLPNLIYQKKIHTSFHQSGTQTGRLSSSHPNLQNIPIKTEQGLKIRKAFIPQSAERLLLSADYSQIELRLVAHLSQDTAMIEAFKQGADIHQSTASRIFQVPHEEVTPSQRHKAKAVNFGILYGISAFGLSENLNSSIPEAKALIDHYFNSFPGIHSFIEKTLSFAREKGYVETLYGRRRYIEGLAEPSRRLFAERAAVNTVVQGTAADMIKMAMIHLHRPLAEYQGQLLLQVHDELVVELPTHYLAEVQALVREKMEEVDQLRVPLKIEMAYGKNWQLIS